MIKILLTAVFTVGIMRHDFHVSVTYMELNSETQNLEMSSKLFTDDLEGAILARFDIDCRIGTANEHPKADSLIFRYFSGNFHLKNDGRKLPLRYIGKETEQDITFIYVEVPVGGALKELTVTNTLFFDRFDDQSNLVNVEVKSELKSLFLKKSQEQGTLVFE